LQTFADGRNVSHNVGLFGKPFGLIDDLFEVVVVPEKIVGGIFLPAQSLGFLLINDSLNVVDHVTKDGDLEAGEGGFHAGRKENVVLADYDVALVRPGVQSERLDGDPLLFVLDENARETMLIKADFLSLRERGEAHQGNNQDVQPHVLVSGKLDTERCSRSFAANGIN